MATYNRTATGGGTVGHPSNAAVPYVMTSPVWDTADGGTGDDVIQMIEAAGNGQVTLDIGFTGGDVDTFMDGSPMAAGFSPFLEASIGASGANCRMLTSADTIDALILDAASTGESAARFRIHVVLADVSKNPTESATVSTGT